MTVLARLYALYRRAAGRPCPRCHHCGQPITDGAYHHGLGDDRRHWHPACHQAKHPN